MIRTIRTSLFCMSAILAPLALHAELRVPTGDAVRAAINHPSPEYSPVARQMKVTGHVEVEATVAADGTVEAVRVVTGNPLLTASAVNAVKRWKFTPFTVNGEAVKAVAALNFDFKP